MRQLWGKGVDPKSTGLQVSRSFLTDFSQLFAQTLCNRISCLTDFSQNLLQISERKDNLLIHNDSTPSAVTKLLFELLAI